MCKLKSLALWFVSPVIRAFMVLGFRIIGYRKLHFGRCNFWGPYDTIEKVRSSLNLLLQIDPKLYHELIMYDVLCFWYHKRDLRDERVTKTFSITDTFLAWGDHGIVARMVYAYFLARRLGRKVYEKDETIRMHKEVRLKTLNWLMEYDFPEQLCEPLKAVAD